MQNVLKRGAGASGRSGDAHGQGSFKGTGMKSTFGENIIPEDLEFKTITGEDEEQKRNWRREIMLSGYYSGGSLKADSPHGRRKVQEKVGMRRQNGNATKYEEAIAYSYLKGKISAHRLVRNIVTA